MATLSVPGTYPTLAAAVAAASPMDTIVVAAGYGGNETVSVTVDHLGFDVPASVTGVILTLASGIAGVTLLGASAIEVVGNADANAVAGNAGANRLDGGAGVDTYIVDSAMDVVVENAGEGTDTVLSSATHKLGANVENLTLTNSLFYDADGAGGVAAVKFATIHDLSTGTIDHTDFFVV